MACNCGKSRTIAYKAVLVGGGEKTLPSIDEANAWAAAQGKRVKSITAVPK